MTASKRYKEFLHQAWLSIRLPLTAIFFGLIVGALAMMWVGIQDGLSLNQILNLPLTAYRTLFNSVFGSFYGFGESLVFLVPLILTGLSITFAFRCGMFNVGAEGQYIVGLFSAAYVGFTFNGLPAWLQMITAIIAAAVGGGLWAAIVGWLKAKRGVHEVITTIMLNYIALHIYNFLVGSKEWFKADKFQGSHAINPAIKIPQIGLFSPSRAHWGIILALLAAIIVYIILWRTKTGFEVRAVGNSNEAARYAGISVAKNYIKAMLISGILAGLAGGIHLLGTQARAASLSAFTGFGADGIAIALIGQNHPLGVVLAAFLFAVMKRGAPLMQAQAGIAKEVVAIVQASIIFFVAADQMVKWIYKRRKKQVKEVASNE